MLIKVVLLEIALIDSYQGKKGKSYLKFNKELQMSHIDRMKVEHNELKQKIDALNGFIYAKEDNIFDTLDKDEQVRMIQQLAFMTGYLGVLDSRLWVAHGNK